MRASRLVGVAMPVPIGGIVLSAQFPRYCRWSDPFSCGTFGLQGEWR